jgi:hypothetical protein
VCFWEDEGLDPEYEGDLDAVSGPNTGTLREARANFRRYGWCEPGPRKSDLADPASYERVERQIDGEETA